MAKTCTKYGSWTGWTLLKIMKKFVKLLNETETFEYIRYSYRNCNFVFKKSADHLNACIAHKT